MVKEKLTGKEFLERLRVWKTELLEKTDELAFWKDMEGSSEDGELAMEIADREAALSLLIRKMKEEKLLATKLIDKIEDPIGRTILRRRYIFGETWEKIACDCGGMSARNAHYIHDNTLILFEKIFSESHF